MQVLFDSFPQLKIFILVGVWLGKDLRTNTIMTCICLKDIVLCLKI